MLPIFLVCGTQRGGTTSIYNYLREHPEVCIERGVSYFTKFYDKKVEWYKSQFYRCENGNVKTVGEKNTEYMYFEQVPERIYTLMPDVKLIFILRNPVDRSYSHYWHEVRLGYEDLSFQEAIEKEEERLSSGGDFEKNHYSYKDRGKYIVQLRRFNKYFSKDQMLVLFTEDLKLDSKGSMKTIFNFLSINDYADILNYDRKYNVGAKPRFNELQKIKLMVAKLPIIKSAINLTIDKINLRKGYPQLDLATKLELQEYFEPYNKKLESFIGRDLSGWSLEK